MRLVRWDMFSFLLNLRKGKKCTGTSSVTVIEQDAAAATVPSPAADEAPATVSDADMRDDVVTATLSDEASGASTDPECDDVARTDADMRDENQTCADMCDDTNDAVDACDGSCDSTSDMCDDMPDDAANARNDSCDAANADDTDTSTCENVKQHDDTNPTDDTNMHDDASDTCDVQRDDTDDTSDAADAVAQASVKEDIYATLRFECGNDMSVTVDEDSVTISRDATDRDDASDCVQNTDRPTGRHYIDAEAVLPGPEPPRYRGFMSYGRGDADEIADRCPASELDFDAILADYDRADHRMVRDVLNGLYGSMAESGEMSEGDPRPFPVYGGAAMPLNNWSWQDVNSVRKHIAHMPLPVVTGMANVAADIKVDDGVDEPQADADAVDSGSEAMHDVPFADSDKGGCDVSGGRHFKHVDVEDAACTNAVMMPVTGAGSDEHDANEEGTDGNSSRASSLVDCGNGYFLYVDGGDDVIHVDNAVDGRCEKGEEIKSHGKSGRSDVGGAVVAGASSGISRGMSDAVKIGCIAAMVIARKAARRAR